MRRCAPVGPLVLIAAMASVAAADRAVIVVGSSKGKELEAVTAAAREAVEQAGWTVVPHKLPPERVSEAVRCSADSDGRCVGQLLDDVGADRLIALRLADERYHDQPVRVTYGAIARRSGEVLASSQRYCEGCREDLLADRVRSLVADLVRSARSTVNPATLVVRSIPSRARVKLDGESIGPTELQVPIVAGAHTLEVALKDHLPHSQEITVRDGEQVKLEIKLVPVAGAPPAGDHATAPAPPRAQRLAPWLLLGGGVVLAIGGGILVAVDEDEVQHGTVVPAYRDTAAAGVILAGTGAIAVVAGAVWLVRARKQPSARAVAPAVMYQGGARIGIAGRF